MKPGPTACLELAGHVDGVGAGRLGEPGVLGGKLRGERAAVLQPVEPHDHGEVVPASGADRSDHVAHQPCAVLDRAPVGIRALVVGGGEERGDEVAVRGVDLDPVEAGLLHALGRIRELLDHPGEVVSRGLATLRALATGQPGEPHQLVHREVVDRDVVRRQGHRRHDLLAILLHVDAGGLAVMTHLHDHLRPVAVDGLCETGEAGDHAVVAQRGLVPRRRPDRIGNRRCLEDQEAGAAARALFVVGDVEVGDLPVTRARVLVHRRHDDAVAHLHRPDATGCQQMRMRGRRHGQECRHPDPADLLSGGPDRPLLSSTGV